MPRAPATPGGGGRTGYRKPKQAKLTGDWAEGIALRFIREQVAGSSHCVHRAAAGETPGWDMDYVDAAGVLQRVEVKGTIGGAFVGVDLTSGEMRAAKHHGPNYWLFLVANCLTSAPKVQPIRDPGKKLTAGTWTAIPALYSIRF